MRQAKISWDQGQPVSDEFGDVYFSSAGGIAETEYVFLQQNKLPELWQGKDYFVIAETGFGTGLNFLTTVMHWLKSAGPASQLHYISVEKFPLSKQDLQQALSVWPEFNDILDEFVEAYPPAVAGFHQRSLFGGRVTLQLLQGDVEDMLAQLSASVDVWYLDGFAPDKNPDMWSEKVFERIASLSHESSRFSTYTAAGFVRRGLQAVGFDVNKVKGFGRKREMLSGNVANKQNRASTAPWFQLPVNDSAGKHVAIIGAGIAGVTTARALANQGWQVELIDKHSSIVAEASGNPLGVIMPRLGLDDSVETQLYTQAYFTALHELSQIIKHSMSAQTSWMQTGVLQLASSARIKKHIEHINCNEELARVLDADQASRISGLKINNSALYYPEAGYLSPESLCENILEQSANNIHLKLNSAIKKLMRNNDEWMLFDQNDRLVSQVDTVVLTNAAAVNQIQQTQWLQLQCVRGQISYLSANQSSQLIKLPVCYDGYVLPEHDGRHILGATFVPDDCSTSIKKEEHQKNLEDINAWFPEMFKVDASSVKGRAATRAVSADRMPVVGPVADVMFYQQAYGDLSKGKPAFKYPVAEYFTGLYVNVAHGARGLTTSFLCADMIAAQINNLPLSVTEKLYHALHPSRFIIRNLKKGR